MRFMFAPMKTLKAQRIPAPNSRRAYTVGEVADQVGTAVDSIYRSIHRGKLRRIAGIGRFMISEAELNRFLGEVK
jgi:excisionase family DNA binding protein